MSELKVLEADFESFKAKAETEGEKLIAEGMAALKNTIALIAKDPALKQALNDGMTVAVSTVLGAGESGGAGAAIGAIEGAATVLLKDVEAPAKSAAFAVVKGEIAAAVEAPLAAVPQVANP